MRIQVQASREIGIPESNDFFSRKQLFVSKLVQRTWPSNLQMALT
jgi:hypothetical protein